MQSRRTEWAGLELLCGRPPGAWGIAIDFRGTATGARDAVIQV